MTKKRLLFTFYLKLMLLIYVPAYGGIEVRVAMDSFPPYHDTNSQGDFIGVDPDMIKIMNQFQSKYEFVIVPTSARRRIEHFKDNRYDMYMSDQLVWGWQSQPVDTTDVYSYGGEKYVALAQDGRGQEFFDDFTHKNLAGVHGYHYGLANFINDPEVLENKYNMQLSATHEGNLLKVVNKRTDIAIVTQAYISHWLLLHPQYQGKLLISNKWDQQYNLVMIIRQGISPSKDELNALINDMQSQGLLAPLWKKYGINNSH